MRRWLIAGGVIIVGVVLVGLVFREQLTARFFSPTGSTLDSAQLDSEPELMVENLATPWSITFLPDGNMLVTEREGRLVRIAADQERIAIDGVRQTSEGGLLGVALDPDYDRNQQIYVYYTTDQDGKLTNQVDRYRLEPDRVSQRQIIIDNIPAASNHNGGAIAFGPDGKLYMTTGDAAQSELAQDTASLAGKIIRLEADGSVPDDNPFGNPAWSYGHRNPQGIAWDGSGQLWSVEHGPSGTESGRDELNRIERGGNYGWPIITGDETKEGMIEPVVQSGADETWAPAGMAYLDGSLYFAGLRGQALYRAIIGDDGASVRLERMLAGEYGRLRAVTAHEDRVYISTSNRDGRGNPEEGDDRILRVPSEVTD